MNERQNEQTFTNLFGKAGEYGGFNDLKRRYLSEEQNNSPPEDAQLKNKVGPDGVNFYPRRGRVRITDLGPIREQGCSEVDGFFDSTTNADDILF